MESDVQPAADANPDTLEPDVMNDPAFAPRAKGTSKNSEDVDSCRICRGDGTVDEPLFYPCKCSGSIKFVHQDCLMEWLSHSQKKHCELCKTPFRFTKLYHPQMPRTLPTAVFLRKALGHMVRGFFTWCRGMLVASIWLFWLPWSMRFVWWGLFWVGDGGWIHNTGTLIEVPAGLYGSQWNVGSDSNPNTSIPSIRTSSNQSTSTGEAILRHPLFQLFQIPRLLFALRSTDQEHQTTLGDSPTLVDSASLHNGSTAGESLLSGITFFQNLTSSPVLNKIVTDILEGQIITLSVVVAFVLVFLIREWVVQQQPGINLGAINQLEINNNRGDVPEDLEEIQLPHAEEETTHDDEQDPSSDSSSAGSSTLHIASSTADRSKSSALERIDELVGENCARLIDHRTEDGIVEDKHAEHGYIHRLTTAMDKTISDFSAQTDGDSSDPSRNWDGLRKLETDIERHATEVRKCLLALQDVSAQALDDEDFELVNVLLENARLLRNAVIRCMPQSLKSNVIEPAEKTEQWIDLGLQLLTSRKDLEKSEKELKELKSKYTDKLKQLPDSGSDSPMRPPSNEDEPRSRIRHRPTMPVRSQSSVAGEIRRGLEESSQSSVNYSTSTRTVDDGVTDRISDTSNGSWQQITSLDRTTPQAKVEIQSPLEQGIPVVIAETQASQECEGEIERPVLQSDQHNRRIPHMETHHAAFMADGATTDSVNHSTTESSTSNDDSFHQDQGAPGTVEVIPHARANVWDRLWDWLWADIAPAEPEQPERENDDEHIVENVADEAPFVPFVDAVPQERVDDHANNQEMDDADDDAVPADAGLAQNDLEAVEDAEDLEGIMELIGMQGPLAGLFQNSIFCAVLISATVTSAVWFPYLWGKIVLVFLANPLQLAVKVPWILVSGMSNFTIDFCLFVGGIVLYWVDSLTRFALIPLEWFIPSLTGISSWNGFGKAVASVADSALVRIAEFFVASNEATAPDFYYLSLSSHAALYAIRSNIMAVLVQLSSLIKIVVSYITSTTNGLQTFPDFYTLTRSLSFSLASAPRELALLVASMPEILRSDRLLPTLGAKALPPLLINGRMPPWTTTDRLIAVVTGYAFFAGIGALYLRVGTPISNSQRGKKIEAIVAEILQQAGGVLKVILIISIEMLLFPLYCGFLLDFATLPLFENASVGSRFNFVLESPWTSGFVHWFLGTCYMFHFALFVSMCRKIVRSGVLYFIRDPDDPTFHPVRDVLERNISSQLRKIGFSALVYGALVILCMGSVVWAVAYAFSGLFPIRWSSDTQLLEFPIDLLIYHTLTPSILHLLKPSKGLHIIYEWWFRKCARALRLSHFLFGEEREDEENRGQDEQGGETTRGGRYVRVPASDQVRVPKGRSVFVEVDANNNRLDGEPDDNENENGEAGANYTKVFVPPWFRLRIALFVFCLWALTAAAGLGFTVAPLLYGRWVLSFAVTPGTKINDIYTFSLGITTFVVAFYVASSYQACLQYLRSTFLTPNHTLSSIAASLRNAVKHMARLVYMYGALVFILPSLFALLLEFYLIMPLHTYVVLRQIDNNAISNGASADQTSSGSLPSSAQVHTIHFLQDWSLGLLYIRILIQVILWRPNTRPARALRTIMERGWLDPNVGLATRCFILPCTILATLSLVVPAPLGWVLGSIYVEKSFPTSMDEAAAATFRVNAIRFAYPALLATAFMAWLSVLLWKAVGTWRGRIRDEVYLIGERLHNFGEMKPPASSKISKVF